MTGYTDITKLYNVTAGEIQLAAKNTENLQKGDSGKFGAFLQAAVNQVNETNSYLQKQEDEEIKLSLGLTENTHDLAIAQAKANNSLQYTVLLRDKFLEAYREIMQIQI